MLSTVRALPVLSAFLATPLAASDDALSTIHIPSDHSQVRDELPTATRR